MFQLNSGAVVGNTVTWSGSLSARRSAEGSRQEWLTEQLWDLAEACLKRFEGSGRSLRLDRIQTLDSLPGTQMNLASPLNNVKVDKQEFKIRICMTVPGKASRRGEGHCPWGRAGRGGSIGVSEGKHGSAPGLLQNFTVSKEILSGQAQGIKRPTSATAACTCQIPTSKGCGGPATNS